MRVRGRKSLFNILLFVAAVCFASLSSRAFAEMRSCAAVFSASIVLRDQVPAISGLLSALESQGRVARLTHDPQFAARMRPGMLRDILASADQLSKILKQDAKMPHLKTIVYPASGFDAGTPFRVFKDADVVIGLDENPFVIHRVEQSRQPGLIFTNGKAAGWTYWGDIENLGGLAESIVDSIEKSLDEHAPVRVLRIYEIAEAGLINEFPIVHGLVEFDNGPGTTVRRYLHLHSSPLNGRTKLPRSARALVTTNYDAVFVKASMGFFRNFDHAYGGYLVDALNERGGIIVDTDAASAMFEWPWLNDAAEQAARRLTITPTGVRGLGYGEAQIVTMKPRR